MSASVQPTPTRPVFVLGCPRSGTTLLQLMLHAHPRIALPPETLPHGLKGMAGRVAERITDGPPTLGSALGIALRAYAEEHGKVRWGDKRPAYALHVAEILRLFPDAQFVHLVRDGRDCVASLLRMPWWHRGFHEAVATWAQVVDTTRKYARELGPDTWYHLRFEDLVADPAGQLRGVCGFLGEEYAPGTTEPHRLAGMAVPARKTWHRRTHGALDTTRAGTWTTRLTPDQLRLSEAVLGEWLTSYGYELAGAVRPDPAELLRYRRVEVPHRAPHAKRRTLDRLARVREPGPVACRPAVG
ncbi:sulfotransferase family protein [Streptomyces mirabilis]|uniref:sulfotransferase family protein n=1 Tax=Streptomyces mirabilis TaxID=68239 RepID=UPI00332A82BA